MSTESLIVKQVGSFGHIVLNRPKALNALSFEMVQRMQQTLQNWTTAPGIRAVLISGVGEKAFCAGGDVKSVYHAGQAGAISDGKLTAEFFRAEYTLNHYIANFPKPYIAFMNGITMGGGVGVAIMGSHRIATEQTVFAMPETGIGLFPDVGGSYFMSRAGCLGLLLALTGKPVRGFDVVRYGFATHFVPAGEPGELISGLESCGIDKYLAENATKFEGDQEADPLQQIADRCFRHDSVESILNALGDLAADGEPLSALAAELASGLMKRSPTSLKITFEQLRRGEQMSFKECLQMEYRLSQACMAGHDFYEGIRALFIDKDHAPKWQPARLEDVGDELVQRHFQELGKLELDI